jgi:hypothetical protein
MKTKVISLAKSGWHRTARDGMKMPMAKSLTGRNGAK